MNEVSQGVNRNKKEVMKIKSLECYDMLPGDAFLWILDGYIERGERKGTKSKACHDESHVQVQSRRSK